MMDIIKKQNKHGIYEYHKKDKNKVCKKEDIEAIDFYSAATYRNPNESLTLFHIANEVKSNIQHGVKRKSMGVKAGVCDYVLLLPNGKFNYLCIELKRENGTTSSIKSEQIDFIKNVNKNGGYACVCFGADAALYVFENYLKNNLN